MFMTSQTKCYHVTQITCGHEFRNFVTLAFLAEKLS